MGYPHLLIQVIHLNLSLKFLTHETFPEEPDREGRRLTGRKRTQRHIYENESPIRIE